MSNGYYSNKMVNTNIKWETTTSSNIGVDFGFFKNKLSGSIDGIVSTRQIYYAICRFQILVGISGPTVNQGEMKNVGWDFVVGYEDK